MISANIFVFVPVHSGVKRNVKKESFGRFCDYFGGFIRDMGRHSKYLKYLDFGTTAHFYNMG